MEPSTVHRQKCKRRTNLGLDERTHRETLLNTVREYRYELAHKYRVHSEKGAIGSRPEARATL
jgi:hypothetical protein